MAWKCYIYECYYKYVQEGDCGLPKRPNLFNLPKATEIQKFLTSLSQVLHHALHSHTSSDVFGLDGTNWNLLEEDRGENILGKLEFPVTLFTEILFSLYIKNIIMMGYDVDIKNFSMPDFPIKFRPLAIACESCHRQRRRKRSASGLRTGFTQGLESTSLIYKTLNALKALMSTINNG